MPSLNFAQQRNKQVNLHPLEIEIGGVCIAHSQMVELGQPYGSIQASTLAQTAENYGRLSANTCRPQLAALVYSLSGQPRAMDWYFPITRTLNPEDLLRFDAFRAEIAEHPNFELHLIAEDLRDVSTFMPDEVRALVAGHLAEVFFFRPDVLERFLASPRYFLIYTSPKAYEQYGGQAGGQYHSDRESIQLVLSRLFEGFNGETPGVAPFLHEFGHMLDFFDAGAGRMQASSSGFLPGLRPGDGAVFDSRARKQFLAGTKVERDRSPLRLSNR
jgi:hypothetical protein